MQISDIREDITEVLVTKAQIDAKIQEVAEQVKRDYEGKDLLLVAVLKGAVNTMAAFSQALRRPAYIVEDIIDSGVTLDWLIKELKGRGAASVEVFALLEKPARHKVSVDVKYKGYVIPDEFVVGFGLDYNEKYRNLDSIAVLNPKVYQGEQE